MRTYISILASYSAAFSLLHCIWNSLSRRSYELSPTDGAAQVTHARCY